MSVPSNLIMLPPPSMPLVTSDNKIERAWYLCLRQVIAQLGGFTAPPISTDDLQQLTDDGFDIASVDAEVLRARIASIEALNVDSDLQNYPSIQDVADALTLANVALDEVDNAVVTGLANPLAKVGLTAVIGTAQTAMRSDAAPPIDQGIAPIWTGKHAFNAGLLASLIATTTFNAGQVAIAGNHILTLTDAGQQIYQTGGAGSIVTIPANAAVPFPLGTLILVLNSGAAATQIAISSDQLFFVPGGALGTRTLAAYSAAFLCKIFATQRFVLGFGIT